MEGMKTNTQYGPIKRDTRLKENMKMTCCLIIYFILFFANGSIIKFVREHENFRHDS